MKKLLILINLFLITGCANSSMPQFPDIKYYYAISLREVPKPPGLMLNYFDTTPLEESGIKLLNDVVIDNDLAVNCLKFEVVEKIPLTLNYIGTTQDVKECNLVGGWKVADGLLVKNWASDIRDWAETKKKCFK
jgi:hypothetical protein